MKKAIVSIMSVAVIATLVIPSYASDWDKAGKILTGIEGLRILTGGKVDIIGEITSVFQGDDDDDHYRHGRHYKHGRKCCRGRRRYIWVPNVVWERKWIPEHEEYSKEYGTNIIVEGHYIRYPVENGGYWSWSYPHDKDYYKRR